MLWKYGRFLRCLKKESGREVAASEENAEDLHVSRSRHNGGSVKYKDDHEVKTK